MWGLNYVSKICLYLLLKQVNGSFKSSNLIILLRTDSLFDRILFPMFKLLDLIHKYCFFFFKTQREAFLEINLKLPLHYCCLLGLIGSDKLVKLSRGLCWKSQARNSALSFGAKSLQLIFPSLFVLLFRFFTQILTFPILLWTDTRAMLKK